MDFIASYHSLSDQTALRKMGDSLFYFELPNYFYFFFLDLNQLIGCLDVITVCACNALKKIHAPKLSHTICFHWHKQGFLNKEICKMDILIFAHLGWNKFTDQKIQLLQKFI